MDKTFFFFFTYVNPPSSFRSKTTHQPRYSLQQSFQPSFNPVSRSLTQFHFVLPPSSLTRLFVYPEQQVQLSPPTAKITQANTRKYLFLTIHRDIHPYRSPIIVNTRIRFFFLFFIPFLTERRPPDA